MRGACNAKMAPCNTPSVSTVPRKAFQRLLAIVATLLLATHASAGDTHHVSGRLASHAKWHPLEQLRELKQQPKSTAPTCTGVLIGIGAQKGGTTAAWAYIKHKAHPMLQVSGKKEVGFWDQVHGWYKGCTLGDYMMLLNGPAQNPAASEALPLCPVPGAAGPMWAANKNRLHSSNICGIRQQLGEAPTAAGNTSNSSHVAGSSIKRCSVPAPRKPWWWFWGGWRSCTTAITSHFGQDGTQGGSSSNGPGIAESNVNSGNEDEGKSLFIDAADVATRPVFHVDITPSYLYDATAPLWVRSMLPEARILVILREPVSRAVSNFNMRWQKLRDAELLRGDTSVLQLSAKERGAAWVVTLKANATRQMNDLSACYSRIGTSAIKQPELAACMGMQQPYSPCYQEAMWSDAMIWQGIYADSLQRWFKLFPSNQFLIWISEDFKEQPAAHMRELVKWLGLDPEDMNPNLLPGAKQLKPIHVREYESTAPEELNQAMWKFFAPHNERLYEVLEAKGFEKVAARLRVVWGQQQPQPHQMEPATRMNTGLDKAASVDQQAEHAMMRNEADGEATPGQEHNIHQHPPSTKRSLLLPSTKRSLLSLSS